MKKRHNDNLDILRGFAAIVVVIGHLWTHGEGLVHKDKNGIIDSIMANVPLPAHICVLVFFVLSGYVIGLNHPVLSDKGMVKDYIKKRLVRLLPIYTIAILFTAIITHGGYSLKVILENLFMISVPLDNIMGADFPLWSLHFEMIYYFVFILFAYSNLNLVTSVKFLLTTLAAIFIIFHKVEIPPLLIGYLVGFIFWISGAMLAKTKSLPYWDISDSRILSIFILICCIQYFLPYEGIMKLIHFSTFDYSKYSFFQTAITYSDMFYYPLAILLILSLSHAYHKIYKVFIAFIFIVCIARLIMIAKLYGFGFVIEKHFWIAGMILASSITLWLLNFGFHKKVKKVLKSTAPIGNISYALYMMHMPLIYLFGLIVINKTDSFIYGNIRLLAFIAVLFFVSYLLERKFQPFIKKALLGKKMPVASRPPPPG